MGDTPAEATCARHRPRRLLPPSCALRAPRRRRDLQPLRGDARADPGCDEARGRPPAAAHRARGGRDRPRGGTAPAAGCSSSRRSASVLAVVQAGAVARDPDGDGSFRVNGGLKAARELFSTSTGSACPPPSTLPTPSRRNSSPTSSKVGARRLAAQIGALGAILRSRLRRPALPPQVSAQLRRCASCLRPFDARRPACPSTTSAALRAHSLASSATTSSASRPKASAGSCADGQPGRPPPPLGDAARHRRRRRGGRRHGARRLGVRSGASPCCGRCGRVGGRRRRRDGGGRRAWSTRRRRRRRATRGWSACG